MHLSALSLAALASTTAARLVLPFGPFRAQYEEASTAAASKHHAIAGIQAQRPLGGANNAKPGHAASDFPAYKHGQHTLVSQDGSVCPSYGEKQWTGTIDVTDTHRLFFWAFESRNDPVNDPVVFWMNGGPGSSSMTGAFNEMGACMMWNDSRVPVPNPWSWNNNATLIFLDQPAGAGFSTVAEGGQVPGTDSDGAEDFQEFLNILFRDVFPEKAHLPIHIAAESYGGHYGPVYIHHILESRRYNAASAFWGNITSMILVDAVLDFAGPSMGSYELLCKDERSAGIITAAECEEMITKLPEAERLSRACEESGNVNVCAAAVDFFGSISEPYDKLVQKGERSPYHLYRGCPDYPLCSNTEKGDFMEYLNRREVKAALKFPDSFTYSEINWDMNMAYAESGSVWVPTTPKVGAILDAYQTSKVVDDGKSVGDIRILVLNGNLDAGINTHGNKMMYERIIWSRMGDYRTAQWQDLSKEGIAGSGSWKGTEDGRLVFMAVDDAGHMVPGDVPEVSYHILQRWLRNGWR